MGTSLALAHILRACVRIRTRYAVWRNVFAAVLPLVKARVSFDTTHTSLPIFLFQMEAVQEQWRQERRQGRLFSLTQTRCVTESPFGSLYSRTWNFRCAAGQTSGDRACGETVVVDDDDDDKLVRLGTSWYTTWFSC